MKYAMKKRLVRLERSLAAPLRPGGMRDVCASVSGASADVLARAKRHAKPLGLGALLCCLVLDLLLSMQMHVASGEVASSDVAAVSRETVPIEIVEIETAETPFRAKRLSKLLTKPLTKLPWCSPKRKSLRSCALPASPVKTSPASRARLGSNPASTPARKIGTRTALRIRASSKSTTYGFNRAA